MIKRVLFIIFSLVIIVPGYCQQINDSYKVLFYNVENLFDTANDSLINDEEFLPEGDRFWNNHKYYSKLNNIYKVIVAIGEWDPPAIIGLCEIENRKVLNDLVNNTPLVKFEYQIIHTESPDRRGIDVGFLYRDDLFKPIYNEAISINFPNNPESKTRDILYVKGIANNADTLDIFINHWPSRWGGQLESEDRRLFVASVLRLKIDSILEINPKSNIIITGDFNDYPDNKSIYEVLNASQEYENIINSELYNLSSFLYQTKNIGTHKYQGEWRVLDQFIVSGNLLDNKNKAYTSYNDIHIFNAEFLLEPDEGYFGYKPKRTFIGFKYNGGFSDHLPTYLILNFNK
ncbi:endonuclease [Bacteroidota bacterium]